MGYLKSIIRLVSVAIILSSSIVFGANVCDPTTGTNCAGVNSTATGGGMHVSQYDLRGNFEGQKATYSASTTALTATASGTGPFFSICGSATKTIRVQVFHINGSVATAAVRRAITLRKTSTSTTAGTATALVQVPRDSTSGAGTANLVNFYTVLATPGTLVGTISSQVRTWPITATIAATDYIPELWWNWDGKEIEGVVLRGTSQCMEAGFDTAPGNAPTLSLTVTWTEE